MNQETQGLLSPWLRNLRLKQVANTIEPNSVVLDLACGAGFLGGFLPDGCVYYGVDRISPPKRSSFDEFCKLDLGAEDLEDVLAKWLPQKPDVVTMVAFVEHVKDPVRIFKVVQTCLEVGGAVVVTTPHPAGRTLHDKLAAIRICSREGAEEHEEFFGREDLESMLTSAGFEVVRYRRFLFGLNQIIVARKLGGVMAGGRK